jgi:outer membrane murein-binding lipoprotein Lpp
MTVAQRRPTRLAAALAAAALGAALLAGCSSENADVNCSVDACTVAFQRGVDASASVLGVDVKLVRVENGNVIVDVEGNEISVPTNGQAAAQGEGLRFEVQEVTDAKIVLRVSRA